ncbi:MAG: hypothetical protein GXZ04_06685 [Clostridiales bacterium]|nr:hypothetical protein [Clostridiales bacterium]
MKKRAFALACALLMIFTGLALAQENWQRPFNKDQGYSYVTFGQYPFEADGTARPLLWRYLETREGVSYLMSEYILHVSRIHNIAQGYPGWDEADLNAWLQEEFVKKAFSEEAAAALFEMEGLGRVSLPSSDDVKNKAFGFENDKARRAIGTPWADENGLFFYRNKGHSPYWMRTPSNQKYAHRSIKLEGNLGYLGVTAEDMGVRPVIWLVDSMLEVSGGSGSMTDPFMLVPKTQGE